jgi:hypothetical protein
VLFGSVYSLLYLKVGMSELRSREQVVLIEACDEPSWKDRLLVSRRGIEEIVIGAEVEIQIVFSEAGRKVD